MAFRLATFELEHVSRKPQGSRKHSSSRDPATKTPRPVGVLLFCQYPPIPIPENIWQRRSIDSLRSLARRTRRPGVASTLKFPAVHTQLSRSLLLVWILCTRVPPNGTISFCSERRTPKPSARNGMGVRAKGPGVPKLSGGSSRKGPVDLRT